MIDPLTLGLMIPISAIVLGIGSGIVQSILKSQERRLTLRLKAEKGQNSDIAKQLEALRAEIAALRDTTTQYDMTNDRIVQRLEERISRVETKAAVAPGRSSQGLSQEEPVQRNGLG